MLVYFNATFSRIAKNEISVKDIILNKYYEESDFSKKSDSSKNEYQQKIEKIFNDKGIESIEFKEQFGKPIAFSQVKDYYIFQTQSDDVSNSDNRKFIIIVFTDEKKILDAINGSFQHISDTLKNCASVEIDNNELCCLYPYDGKNRIKYNHEKILELSLSASKNKISRFKFFWNITLTSIFVISTALIFVSENPWQSIFVNISSALVISGIAEYFNYRYEIKNKRNVIRFNDISEILLKYHSVISLDEEKQHMDKLEEPLNIREVFGDE